VDADDVQETIRRFVAAWSEHDSATDKAAAAKQFGERIDALIRERSLARSLRSSLAKGMTAFEFWRR
jgi:hypothetical protein